MANLVTYNVLESEATAGLERKEEDLKQLNNLFKEQVTPNITEVTQLGKRDDKPQLLEVSVASADQRSGILRNKVKLKKDSNPEHTKSIFIAISRLYFSRAEEKKSPT